MADSSRGRIAGLDCARAFAIIAVVLCHATEFSFDVFSGLATQAPALSYFATASLTIGRLGVPLFLFLTGYFLLPRHYDQRSCFDFWKKRWLPLLLCCEFWIIVYTLFLACYNQTGLSFVELARHMLFLDQVDMIHFWYIPLVLALYLVIPLIGAILERMNRRVSAAAIAVVAVLAFGIPTAGALASASGNSIPNPMLKLLSSGSVYLSYLMIGYLFGRPAVSKNQRRPLRAMPTAALAIAAAIFFCCCVFMQSKGWPQGISNPIWYSNGFLAACSICLFEAFRRIEMKGLPMPIASLSRYSFAIYLLHAPFMMVFLIPLGPLAPSPVACELALWLLSLGASWGAAIALSKIPVIGKRMFYLK